MTKNTLGLTRPGAPFFRKINEDTPTFKRVFVRGLFFKFLNQGGNEPLLENVAPFDVAYLSKGGQCFENLFHTSSPCAHKTACNRVRIKHLVGALHTDGIRCTLSAGREVKPEIPGIVRAFR